ncbi:restriction endonuclease subunit S [Aerosakkonemataceae cyanobacterium BLCC-F50]|uniref:Restriction endonuclease subunit S n=1 Tax=Floridaenema flaviceps BLCC-F50 TaxID=3153642 RepID=A0ABV4XU23_9CYAN
MTKKAKNKVPELRFPEFHGDWETNRVDRFLVRYVNPVKVEPETIYKQIGIRSHGKGIFHKDPVTGEALGNKRVYWVHPEAFTINIVFAWEQAVALTSSDEEGYIASHRFLMFLPKENRADLNFVLLFFLRKHGKHLLELASPGGAGRNKTLGQDSFAELEITLPKKEEQKKIASFLEAVNARLTHLCRKRELLQTYKRGVMQKLFSQKIRFKQSDGSPFSNWEEKKLGEVFDFKNGINAEKSKYGRGKKFINVLDIINDAPISHDSIIGSVEITEQEFENNDVKYGDILFQRSSEIREEAGQSNVYLDKNKKATFGGFVIRGRPKISFNPIYFHNLLKTEAVRKEITNRSGGSTRFNVGQDSLSEVTIVFCTSIEEQGKIADFLTAIDQKIEAISHQIDCVEQFKKGLLQKMFV